MDALGYLTFFSRQEVGKEVGGGGGGTKPQAHAQ